MRLETAFLLQEVGAVIDEPIKVADVDLASFSRRERLIQTAAECLREVLSMEQHPSGKAIA